MSNVSIAQVACRTVRICKSQLGDQKADSTGKTGTVAVLFLSFETIGECCGRC